MQAAMLLQAAMLMQCTIVGPTAADSLAHRITGVLVLSIDRNKGRCAHMQQVNTALFAGQMTGSNRLHYTCGQCRQQCSMCAA